MKFFLLFLITLSLGCTSSDPVDMAKAFCDCVKNSENSDNQECIDLATSHKERLTGDTDKMQKYADEVLKCTNVSK